MPLEAALVPCHVPRERYNRALQQYSNDYMGGVTRECYARNHMHTAAADVRRWMGACEALIPEHALRGALVAAAGGSAECFLAARQQLVRCGGTPF